MKQGATAQIAVQPGWYHSLVGLLIEAPMTINPVMEKPGSRSISDLIDLKSPEEDVGSMDDLTDGKSRLEDFFLDNDVHLSLSFTFSPVRSCVLYDAFFLMDTSCGKLV